ncbi:unnamed protein product [Rhizophagus irregularis]|nr:unnamed protein product [Rhizophagus irregularis]
MQQKKNKQHFIQQGRMILVFLAINRPDYLKKLKIENVDIQNDHEREIMQQQSNIGINDEAQNNPNLHSEEKDK